MATRAQISRFSGPTQIETLYNHYDGYPEYLGKALKDHHYDQDSVMDIMDGGNVRAIDSETGEVEHYENEPSKFINGDSMATVIGNYAEHINNEGGAYAYIWDGEDFHTIKNNGVGGMIDQLTKIFIDEDMNENKEFDLKEYLTDNKLFNLSEALNPEVTKAVNRLIKAMAKKYGYEEKDAVFAIQAALKQTDMDS